MTQLLAHGFVVDAQLQIARCIVLDLHEMILTIGDWLIVSYQLVAHLLDANLSTVQFNLNETVDANDFGGRQLRH